MKVSDIDRAIVPDDTKVEWAAGAPDAGCYDATSWQHKPCLFCHSGSGGGEMFWTAVSIFYSVGGT